MQLLNRTLLSKILNPAELRTFPYFGDGAAATLITSNVGGYKLVDFVLGSDGSGSEVIYVPAGGTMLPGPKVENQKDFYFKMNGREVYDFACDKGRYLIRVLSERNDVVPDIVIPYQANINVIKEIGSRSGLGEDMFYTNLDRYANTAGASVLIALDEYLETKSAPKNIFMIVFGGGLSWGGCYLRRC